MQASPSTASSSGKGLLSMWCRSDTPVVVRNPDGSMATGVPPDYKEPQPPRHTPQSELGRVLLGAGLGEAADDPSEIYDKHSALFMGLLLAQVFVELTFDAMYVAYRETVVKEVHAVYPMVPTERLWRVFWGILTWEASYGFLYYSLGIIVVYAAKPVAFDAFSVCSFVGITGQVVLAYLNKFNLILFVLKLIAFLHCRFLREISEIMRLAVPRGEP
mmetsp:Transcript_57732/g.154242  ORF Transcript_57732/g.154242 Transcript_57732/m.154242 type:complete len:217 (+) Transcript_57732:108-758(+)